MFFVFSLVVLFRSYKSAKRPHKLVYQEPLNDLKNKVKTNETKSITSLWVSSKSFIGCHFAFFTVLGHHHPQMFSWKNWEPHMVL